MTYQQAAQTALDVQDACNLSGVVFSFAEAMNAVCEEQQRIGQGTKWKNEHPVVYLFVSKLADLNGYHIGEAYSEMSDQVKQIAATSK